MTQMSADRSGKARHLIWWMLLLGALGMLGYFLKFQDVFPAASIDLKLTRAQALSLSKRWADDLGYPSEGAIASTVFSDDDDAKTFLEHEVGLSQASALMKDEVPVWYWSTRLCRPLKLEEFSASISPTGRLLSFDHSIGNDRAMPSIPHDDARAQARQFVREKLGMSLDNYKPIEDGSVKQPHRTDHFFVWEETSRDYKGARLRIYTYLSGNQVTGFNHYLYVPEQWLRRFSEMRSYNNALEEVASIFYSIFGVATIFAFIWMFTRGAIRWRLALGVGGAVGVMYYLDALNALPNSIRSYATTMSYNGYLVDVYVSALWGAIGQAFQTFILVGAAEGLYRMAYPGKLALEHLFSTAGLRCRQAVSGLVAGHALFGMHVGWIILYYLAGQPLHFWSPLEVRNTEGLSTIFPFYSAMFIGVSAAVSEELTYRVLGMSIFQKLVKQFWLANLLQAAAWAFMHSNYPQEPAYARGLELTVVGLVYGGVLRRYGLIASIASHYIFDAFLSVTPLLSSAAFALRLSAIAAVLPFVLALAVALYLVRKSGWSSDQELANSAIPAHHAPAPAEEIFPTVPYQYRPLSRLVRGTLAAIAIAGSIMQFGWHLPTVGQQAALTISRDEAIQRARQYLVLHNLPPMGRSETAWLARGMSGQELLQLQYLFEKLGMARTRDLATSPCNTLVWKVRFFRPLDPEEYQVTIDGRGRIVGIDVTRAEDAPGARLTEEQAQHLAEGYLKSEHPELLPYQLESSRKEEHKARTDYRFTFRVPRYSAPQAEFKVAIRVVGNVVGGFDQSWDLPDEWLFERSRQRTKDQICGYVNTVIGLAAILAVIWWAIGVVRSVAFHWRPPIILALVLALLVIPQALNSLPEFYLSYSTDTPLLSYFIAQTVRQIVTAVSMIGVITGLAAFALASFRILFPRSGPMSVVKATIAPEPDADPGTQKQIWIDAVLIGYAAGIGSRALTVLYSAAHLVISPVVTLAPLESFCGFANVLSPTVDVLMDSCTRGLQITLTAAVLAGLYAKYFRSVGGYLLFGLAISLIYPLTDRYWQDYLLDAASYILYFLTTWVTISMLARQNMLAYFLAGAASVIAGALRVLIEHGASYFLQDIAILTLVLASPAVYVFLIKQSRD